MKKKERKNTIKSKAICMNIYTNFFIQTGSDPEQKHKTCYFGTNLFRAAVEQRNRPGNNRYRKVAGN